MMDWLETSYSTVLPYPITTLLVETVIMRTTLFNLSDSPKRLSNRLSDGLTSDMISPPLSPDSGFDPNRITPSILSALEYVANKFLSVSTHVRFIVARPTPLPIGQGSSLNVIPITPLDRQTQVLFAKYIRRAAKKYYLSAQWMTTLDLGDSRPLHWEYIIERTLIQNDILYSHEGLTLFNIDHMYSLKQQLSALSRDKTGHIPKHIYLESCLYLLRQIMHATHGRPFTRAFMHCTYDHFHVRDDILLCLEKEYEAKYGREAIIMFKPKLTLTTTSKRKTEYYINNRGSLKRQPSQLLNPLTPNSASDITPVTRGEWKVLLDQNLTHLRVGRWG